MDRERSLGLDSPQPLSLSFICFASPSPSLAQLTTIPIPASFALAYVRSLSTLRVPPSPTPRTASSSSRTSTIIPRSFLGTTRTVRRSATLVTPAPSKTCRALAISPSSLQSFLNRRSTSLCSWLLLQHLAANTSRVAALKSLEPLSFRSSLRSGGAPLCQHDLGTFALHMLVCRIRLRVAMVLMLQSVNLRITADLSASVAQ
mmetsp:Transcript_39185/g.96454  ORF Transcript_39185/g.96454 Transcript_39185/m.96454 type:complete len:203 (+) Transcript_39185:694-1302(+)